MSFMIETRRCVMRHFQPDDLVDFHRLGSDPDIIRYTGDPGGGFRDLDHAREILLSHPIADYQKYGYGRWAVVHRADDRLIGFCGPKYLDDLGEVDLGYRFVPEYWGQGIATETAKAALDHAFTELGLEELIAFVLEGNGASARVLEKLGMQATGETDYPGTLAMRYAIRRPASQG